MTTIQLTCYITRKGMLIIASELSKIIDLVKLQKKLTMTKVTIIGKQRYIKTMEVFKYIVSPNNVKYLTVARFCGIKTVIQGLLKNKETTLNIHYINNIPDGLDLSSKFSETLVDLEEYQQICLDYLMDNIYNESKIKAGSASCIFVMDTGMGKTFMAAALIEKLKTKTLVIIPNKSNLDGWADPFRIYLTNLTLTEYNSTTKVDGDVVVMTIKSALSDEFKFKVNKKETVISYTDYFKQFGLVIFDEIHNYPTNTQAEIFWRTNFQYGLGLTATPDERADDMDIVYYKHVGKVIKAKDIPGFLENSTQLTWTGTVNVIEYYGPPEFTEQHTNSLGWVDTGAMQKQFTRDQYRNTLLIQIIKEKILRNRFVFVFVLYRDFLNDLMKMLIEQNIDVTAPELAADKKIASLMGGVDRADVKSAKATAQVILLTYNYGKESISIVRFNTIIFAQPMRNRMRQILGRILRQGGDVSIEREITDLRDMNTSLKSQFSTRKKIYIEKGFTIQYKPVKYQDVEVTEPG